MLYIQIDSLDTVNKLCSLCDRHRDDFYVDLVHGRQIIDGCSIIGVTSLVGKIVNVKPITEDENNLEKFYDEIIQIGGFSA